MSSASKRPSRAAWGDGLCAGGLNKHVHPYLWVENNLHKTSPMARL
jgi:hypothetical protein